MPNGLEEALAQDRATALALTPVSRETAERLDRFVALLVRWQATTNLVASSTLPQLWTRHVADSLQLLPLAPRASAFVDLGSGGGFPGIVLACALAERSGAHVHLVERTAKKAAFLREALRITQAPGTVHHLDIVEFVDSFDGQVDCITARALTSLKMLLGFAAPFIARGATALFLKGQDVDIELTEAAKYWTLTPELIPSRTGGKGWVVKVERLASAAARDFSHDD